METTNEMKAAEIKHWAIKELVRELTEYEIAKQIGITQTQLKSIAKTGIGTREIALVVLQELSGKSVTEFWEELREQTKAIQKDRIKQKLKNLD